MGQSKSIGNIKACVDASLAVMQELAYATARKGKKFGATCGITCFGCKKPGHLRKDCKNLSGDKKSIPLGPSQCCDKHWRSECKSKSHKDGTPLTRKWVRQRTIELHVLVVKNRGTWVRIVKIPRGNKKGLSPGLCPGWGGNLGGMIADQSPIRMGLCSLRSR